MKSKTASLCRNTARSIIGLLCLLFLNETFSQPLHEWSRTNPGGGGAFSTVEAGPTGQVIAGSDLSGAYYSWDNGQTWDVYGAEKGMTATHVSGIGFHPDDENIFFIGTENGIFKSEDGGDSFDQVLNNGYISDIKPAPSDPQTVYANYHPSWNSTDGAVYRSTDGGNTWIQVSSNLPAGHPLLKLIVHPTNPNIVFVLSGAARFACGPASLFKSIDGGVNWTQSAVSLGQILDAAIHPTDGNILYITNMNADCTAQFYWTNLQGNIYKSTDGGTTWGAPLTDKTGCIWIKRNQPSTIRLIDPREPYPWTDGGTWESTNSGTTWDKTGDVTNWQTGYQNSLFWSYGSSYNGICKTLGQSLADPERMYWVTNQWVFSTSNGGVTFEHNHTQQGNNGWWTSTGADNVVMFDISINESNPDEIYAAFADIGLWRSLDHGENWQSCNKNTYTGGWQGFGGNVNTVLTDPSMPEVVWTVMQGNLPENAFLLYSNQAGDKNSWVESNAGLPVSNRITGLSLDRNSPVNNRTLFVCANGDVYKSTNHGANWTKILTNGGLWFTNVDHFDGNIVYAGGRNGFWRSLDGGSTWSNTGLPVMAGAPNDPTDIFISWAYRGISCISPDPNQKGVVYVTAYGPGRGAYISANSGTTWTQIYSGNYMRSIAVTPQNPNVLYAGSSSAFYSGGYNANSKGVLYSSDGGITWSQVNGDMAWPFALIAKFDHAAPPNVFVGSPGTGFQFSAIPDINCTLNLTINNANPIAPGEYRSEGPLHAFNSMVTTGKRVLLKSNTEVTLQNNFTVEAGSIFEAKIEGCQ